MHEIEQLEVNLDKSHYTGGDILSGCLTVSCTRRISIESIVVRVYGQCVIAWNKEDAERSAVQSKAKTQTIPIYDEEKLFQLNHVIYSVEPGDADDELFLEIGEVQYRFNVQLPPNLPTSFQHRNAYIRYTAKGIIHIAKMSDQYALKHFPIVNDYDLNKEYALRLAQEQSGSTLLSKYWCCKSPKPVSATFTIKKSGYVPGESIEFIANIDNKSSNELNAVIRLVQGIRLYQASTGRRAHFTREVLVLKCPIKVMSETCYEWLNTVKIPSVCHNLKSASRAIEVMYFIQLHVDLEGTFSIEIPVTIGTKPLRSETDDRTFEPSFYECCVYGPIACIKSESVSRSGEVRIGKDDDMYTPYYPIYSFDTEHVVERVRICKSAHSTSLSLYSRQSSIHPTREH